MLEQYAGGCWALFSFSWRETLCQYAGALTTTPQPGASHCQGDKQITWVKRTTRLCVWCDQQNADNHFGYYWKKAYYISELLCQCNSFPDHYKLWSTLTILKSRSERMSYMELWLHNEFNWLCTLAPIHLSSSCVPQELSQTVCVKGRSVFAAFWAGLVSVLWLKS